MTADEYKRRYHGRYRGRYKEYRHRYYEAHKEQERERQRKYYEAHRDYFCKYGREYRRRPHTGKGDEKTRSQVVEETMARVRALAHGAGLI